MKHNLIGLVLAFLVVFVLTGACRAVPSSGTAYFSDYNGDSVVDAVDYAIWRNSFGDFNQDAVVDAIDYAIWRSNFAGTSGASVDQFNGSKSGLPVAPHARLAWRSVPLSGMFDTPSAYSGWVKPMTTTAGLAGDYNNDGVVDSIDYAVWRDALLNTANVGKFLAVAGDFDSDSVVDAIDYVVWRDSQSTPNNNNTPSGFVAGDFDQSSIVDAADYTIWRSHLGITAAITPGNDWLWLIDPWLSGDANNDGFVGISDLNLVLGNWNRTVSPPGNKLAGDYNADGFVGIGDLNSVLGNWNAGMPPPGSNASIPEPAGVTVLLIGLGLQFVRVGRVDRSVLR